MEIKITAFGIAKDIIQAREIQFSLNDFDTIRDLKTKLIETYPEFEKLATLSFAVSETYQSDDYVFKINDHVVIIPPVSGG
jgi:molybdopterin synthase sulfur carrier subunit